MCACTPIWTLGLSEVASGSAFFSRQHVVFRVIFFPETNPKHDRAGKHCLTLSRSNPNIVLSRTQFAEREHPSTNLPSLFPHVFSALRARESTRFSLSETLHEPIYTTHCFPTLNSHGASRQETTPGSPRFVFSPPPLQTSSPPPNAHTHPHPHGPHTYSTRTSPSRSRSSRIRRERERRESRRVRWRPLPRRKRPPRSPPSNRPPRSPLVRPLTPPPLQLRRRGQERLRLLPS